MSALTLPPAVSFIHTPRTPQRESFAAVGGWRRCPGMHKGRVHWIFQYYRGRGSENPRIGGVFLGKCLFLKALSARVAVKYARVGSQCARVLPFSAHPSFQGLLLSLSLYIIEKKEEKRACEGGGRQARGARVRNSTALGVRGFGGLNLANARKPAQREILLFQAFMTFLGEVRGCAGGNAPGLLFGSCER